MEFLWILIVAVPAALAGFGLEWLAGLPTRRNARLRWHGKGRLGPARRVSLAPEPPEHEIDWHD